MKEYLYKIVLFWNDVFYVVAENPNDAYQIVLTELPKDWSEERTLKKVETIGCRNEGELSFSRV
jgi:hypothetical protein